MRDAVACFLVALLLSQAARAQASRPVAIFATSQHEPTFMFDCRNTSAAPIRPMGLRIATKLDGNVIESRGGGGSVGPEPLGPAQSWKVMIVLRQKDSTNGAGQNHLGERRQVLVSLPMTIGLHRLAFRCAGNWSEEIEFYWNFASN